MKSSLLGEIWLGYSGLSVESSHISAIIQYQPAWDRRIVQSHGAVPAGVQCVVVLQNGDVLPAGRAIDDLRNQWTAWQAEHDG